MAKEICETNMISSTCSKGKNLNISRFSGLVGLKKSIFQILKQLYDLKMPKYYLTSN